MHTQGTPRYIMFVDKCVCVCMHRFVTINMHAGNLELYGLLAVYVCMYVGIQHVDRYMMCVYINVCVYAEL